MQGRSDDDRDGLHRKCGVIGRSTRGDARHQPGPNEGHAVTDYAKALGARLRAIRQQQGLSLHGVEEKSVGRWKAVVVGVPIT